MPNATQIGEARAANIVALADEAGVLEHVEGVVDFRADDQAGVVTIAVKFLFRDFAGKEVLTPHRRGEDEPFVLIDETRHAPDGRLDIYNYDLVFPARKIHFGYHHHAHKGIKYPHRQGYGVPGGHERFAIVDLERDHVLWSLITQAFLIDNALN